MNRTARSLLFWLFILSFLVAAPLSVLYTAGYRYNPKNGSIVRTGVISVTSTPRNVGIALNGRELGKTTPYIIKYVFPGTYRLTLMREGFHQWGGNVEVTSGATTNVHGAFLFLDSQPAQQFIKELDDVSPSPDGSRAAYLIREGGWDEIWLFDTKRELPWMIDRFTAGETEPELIWSADGSRLLALSETIADSSLYDSAGAPLQINDDLFLEATNLFWHPSDGSILYAATETELRTYDFDTGATTALETSENQAAASVLIDASILTFIDNGANIELYQTVGEEADLIALLPRSTYEVAERDDSFIILKDRRFGLILLDIRAERPILLETSARVYDWMPETDKLVWSDGNEVSIYTPSSHTTEFITRQSDFIESIAWHPTGATILIGTRTKLSAIEANEILEDRVMTTLLDAQNMETFWTTSNGQTIYFYGTVEGATGLYSLELTR